MFCGRKLLCGPHFHRVGCFVLPPWEQKIPMNYLEFFMENLFSPVLCLNHLFVSVWTQIFIPWIITQYCFTYSVAQIIVNLPTGTSFSWYLYPFDIFPLLTLYVYIFFEHLLTLAVWESPDFVSCLSLRISHFSKEPRIFSLEKSNNNQDLRCAPC